MVTRELVLILHNIRSALNVGALFRTAEATRVTHIYLTGYTPTPRHTKVAKTALGAQDMMPWTYARQIGRVLGCLRDEGFFITALEQSPRSVELFDFAVPVRLALILGTEVTGLTPTVLRHCTVVLEIPMYGKKESLNVSVSAGIVLFRLREG